MHLGTTMKNSPLQLIRYLVPEIACSANPAFDPEKPCDGGLEQFSVEASVNHQDAPKDTAGNAWSLEMRLSQKLPEGKNFPYKFELTVVGFFICKDGVPPQAGEERFVRINGSSMLYGAARELVRTTTAMGPWGALLLPTISFYGKDANHKEDAAAAAKP